MSNYRWDIQGLRAIAVLAVVIFHINPKLLSGGYIGVDVFFVISGYLIMGIIWRDLESGDFSLTSFYARRMRRLFPALFVMVAISSLGAYFILLPNENIDFNKSLIATLFNISNFYFYLEADYFNDMMEFAPLLHTWSLSVEEQFYLLSPMVLIYIFTKQKAKILLILVALFILFLLLSQIAIYYDKSFAFFASPTRFFQFILGGVVAISLQKNLLSKTKNDFMGAVGLLMIMLSLYFYDKSTVFPGVNALFPSMGTALILFSGQNSRYISWLLSNRIFKLIGNASYSIYLWHWPLIVFYKLEFSPSLSRVEQLGLFLGSLVIGYLSWKYIEQTTRKNSQTNLKSIYTVIAISFALSAMAFLVIYKISIDSLAYKNRAYKYLEYNASKFRSGECFLTSEYDGIEFFNKSRCVTHTKNKKNYLLIGDSHAAHFYSALEELKKEGETITQITASGCHPTLPYSGVKRCQDLFKWAFEELVVEKRFETIILSAHWKYPEKESLLKSINYLKKYTNHIIVLGANMEYLQSLPRLLIALPKEGKTDMIYKTAGRYQDVSSVDYYMKSYLKLDGVRYISILHILCDQESCRTITDDGTPINFDSSHLTHKGALYIMQEIAPNLFDR